MCLHAYVGGNPPSPLKFYGCLGGYIMCVHAYVGETPPIVLDVSYAHVGKDPQIEWLFRRLYYVSARLCEGRPPSSPLIVLDVGYVHVGDLLNPLKFYGCFDS
jgi:hypothetical protein